MSKLIKDATLLGIADAIRAKTGTTDPIKVGSFASAIEGIDTGATDGMFCWAKFNEKFELPIGYTPVEYIQTTGTEYFDTGYAINNTVMNASKVVADMAVLATNAAYRVSGASSSPVFYVGLNPNNYYGFGAYKDIATSVTGDTERHVYTLDMVSSKFTVDDVVDYSFTYSNAATQTYNFFISAFNNGGTASNIHATRIYRFSFYESGELVHDFLPCLDRDGNVCLHDVCTGEDVFASGGTPQAVNASEVVRIDSYTLSDNLNAYPQDGYHTDGYYYRLMENDIQWDERGQYAWSKNDTTNNHLTVSGTGVTLTETDGVYGVVAGTGSAWGSHYFNSTVYDFGEELHIYHTVNTITSNYHFGFSDAVTATYTDLDAAIQIDTAGTIRHWANGSAVASYGSCAVGDVIHLELKNGTMSAYQNDTLLFSTAVTLTECVAASHFYYASANYGTFEIVGVLPNVIGYVVTNAESAYPNDDYADDGYYYVKVGATKVSPKYASGQTIPDTSATTLTVSGLGFRPYAVAIYHDNSTTSYDMAAFGICNELGVPVSAVVVRGASALATATFTPNDDGFTYKASAMGSYSVAVNWYAIGY